MKYMVKKPMIMDADVIRYAKENLASNSSDRVSKCSKLFCIAECQLNATRNARLPTITVIIDEPNTYPGL